MRYFESVVGVSVVRFLPPSSPSMIDWPSRFGYLRRLRDRDQRPSPKRRQRGAETISWWSKLRGVQRASGSGTS